MMEKLRMFRMQGEMPLSHAVAKSSGGADYREIRWLWPVRAGDSAGWGRPRAQQPQELLRLEPVPAHDQPVEQQHRHIEAVAAQ
jgi:hypothetical protein